MEFVGSYIIPASPSAVWNALNDPDVLKACIPGCESLAKTDATHFVATARLKIGPMSATFKGAIALTELDPPRRCVLSGEGQGGVAGFAKGSAEVLLTPEGEGTRLAYTAKASVGGKLAQIGQRLIDGAARQIADDFFVRFSAEAASMEKGGTLTPDSVMAPPPQIHQEAQERAPPREGLAPEVWVIGLIAVIVILLALFGFVLEAP
jgi:hypothetical protein